MANLTKVVAVWSGFPGAPGTSTFYFNDTSTTYNGSIASLFAGLAPHLPTDVTITIPTTGDTIDEATGAITGNWIQPEEAPISGTDASGYAAPVGCMAKWSTADVVHGHRVKGRTFFVPITATQYQNNGTINTASLTPMTTAVTDFQISQDGSLVVWSRPFAGTPAVGTRPANPARVGSAHIVTSATMPDKAVVLRSRRD